jgi:hypothetical protein
MFELVNPKILAWVFDISRKGGVHIEFFYPPSSNSRHSVSPINVEAYFYCMIILNLYELCS